GVPGTASSQNNAAAQGSGRRNRTEPMEKHDQARSGMLNNVKRQMFRDGPTCRCRHGAAVEETRGDEAEVSVIRDGTGTMGTGTI
ncbi:MAG: hypothetical protein QOJ54_2452, partial [Aliidongia sp.]|nr:hypothetical protein [Aliidongia sp.]